MKLTVQVVRGICFSCILASPVYYIAMFDVHSTIPIGDGWTNMGWSAHFYNWIRFNIVDFTSRWYCGIVHILVLDVFPLGGMYTSFRTLNKYGSRVRWPERSVLFIAAVSITWTIINLIRVHTIFA